MFRELFDCRFADSIGASDEDCDKTGWYGGPYAVIGRLYDFKRDHVEEFDAAEINMQ